MGYCKYMEDDWDFWTDNRNDSGTSAYWETIVRRSTAETKETDTRRPAQEGSAA